MKKPYVLKASSLLLSVLIAVNAFAQDDMGNSANQADLQDTKGFHFGLYIGGLFANQYTANLYDGYGFDVDGKKNNWDNSFMNQKINLQYGGKAYSGQTDYIAQELKVDPGTWTFSEIDMQQIIMRYTPAFSVGLTGRYTVDTKNAILINVNASKLNISGSFNIHTMPSNSGSNNQTTKTLQPFPIKGSEQRLIMQLGYQHLFGDGPINFLLEGGLHATLTKFDKNVVQINNLTIDLTSYANSVYFASATPFKRPVGIGFGAFGGMGVNLSMNPKATIQLVYSPTYEKINIGENPQHKLQNSIGIRLYYSMFPTNITPPNTGQ